MPRMLTTNSTETVDVHGNVFINGVFVTDDDMLAETLLKVSWIKEVKEEVKEVKPTKPKKG